MNLIADPVRMMLSFRWMTIISLIVIQLCAVSAQQFAGDQISNSLPFVRGSEIAYWKIADPAGSSTTLTLTNYWSLRNDLTRLNNVDVKRVVVIVHGLNRDANNYMNDVSVQAI